MALRMPIMAWCRILKTFVFPQTGPDRQGINHTYALKRTDIRSEFPSPSREVDSQTGQCHQKRKGPEIYIITRIDQPRIVHQKVSRAMGTAGWGYRNTQLVSSDPIIARLAPAEEECSRDVVEPQASTCSADWSAE
jgi:hypothetical protein